MAAAQPHLFEDILDEYECSWKAGRPVSIRTLFEKFRSAPETTESESAELLSELLLITLEYNWRDCDSTQEGVVKSLEEFSREWRGILKRHDQTERVLLEEFRIRHLWGDSPTIEDFVPSEPELVRQLTPRLAEIQRELELEDSIRKLFEGQSARLAEGDTDVDDSMLDFIDVVYPFSDLPENLRTELISSAKMRHYASGDLLMKQGDPSESLMVILDGLAQIMLQSDDVDRTEQELARVGSFSLLGEIGLLTGEARTANVVAMCQMKVAEISYETCRKLAGRFPSLNMMLSELVAERVGTISTDIMFGKTFGGYRFRHRLGRGSMGIVYLAEDQQSQKQVAIKMLRHDLVYDRQASVRFRREAEVIRRLQHENIIQVYHEFSAYNTFFLSMEYCEGSTLSEAIRYHAPFSFDDVRRMVGQLAAALLHAHEQGVIHRDLKPANVILTQEGMLKLTDFGLARSVECLKMTAHGQMLGTPRYMPSELLGGGEADETADIYALGLITWELLTGKSLFDASDIVSLLKQQLQWSLPPAEEIADDLPEDLYEVLGNSLSQTPCERTLKLQPLSEWAEPIPGELCHRPQKDSSPSNDMESTMSLTEDKSSHLDDISSAK